jgi:hypothetical protein
VLRWIWWPTKQQADSREGAIYGVKGTVLYKDSRVSRSNNPPDKDFRTNWCGLGWGRGRGTANS